MTIKSFGFGMAMVLAAMFAISCNKEDQSAAPPPKAPANQPTTSHQIFKASDPNALKLAFVTNNVSDFWKIAAAGVHKYEKEAGVTVTIKMPSTAKTDEQNRIVENLTSQDFNGIAISVITPKDQVDMMNRAASKTNVITFDSDCTASNRLLYIGTNNFEAGKVLGAQIVKMLPNGGKMAVFVGSLAADNAAQRLGGIVEAIKGHSIDIVAKKEDATDHAKARSNVEDVLNAYSDINLVCGLWSYNGPAISDAIQASGKKGKVLAAVFDEEQGTLDGIKTGTIQCTCVQKPFQFGYLASKWLHDLATQGDALKLPDGGVVDTGVDIIDAQSVDEYAKKLAEMKAGA
ncbi:MAG: substrate-binding domain-containing protein [Phycisphaerae bacterium]|nr:substrate-binding domain-containing protein [Phycisphaerae bacterium]